MFFATAVYGPLAYLHAYLTAWVVQLVAVFEAFCGF